MNWVQPLVGSRQKGLEANIRIFYPIRRNFGIWSHNPKVAWEIFTNCKFIKRLAILTLFLSQEAYGQG
jgi:hypothetical protein